MFPVQVKTKYSIGKGKQLDIRLRMSTGFRVVNREFLHQLEHYIKRNATVEKKRFMDVPDRILKANIAYQYLGKMTNKDLTLQEIHGKGLIGPGQGHLTKMLEQLFGSSKTFKTHAMLHDVFGNFYLDHEEGPGYAYASPVWLLEFLRDESLVGQISGLLFCLIIKDLCLLGFALE